MTGRPYVRWWWFSGPIRKDDIVSQLEWLSRNDFGGVEIAWVYALDKTLPAPAWLSREWSELVSFTKQQAQKLGLRCDFTFGSLWPFGGSMIGPEHASRTFKGPSAQRLRRSWEERDCPEPLILNHLDRHALEAYAAVLGKALAPALAGATSSIFCDSWEVAADGLWTDGFEARFKELFGYDLGPYMTRLDQHPDVRYDYRALLSEYVLNEFYRPFTDIAHRLGAQSRVQCHGAPTDLMAAYAAADIPETEAVLFDPQFAQLAASAAAIADRPIVSAEAFTCLYGWLGWPGPGPHQGEELVRDLKLVADALFANGVNLIIWHGMPYNPPAGKNRFYASVHVGPDAAFADDLPGFNSYLAKVSGLLQPGTSYSDVAVYLPLEDNWMRHELPEELKRPSAAYHWELQDQRFPAETIGYRPTWISAGLLENGFVMDGLLHCGAARFRVLYIDAQWLSHKSLQLVYNLARMGLPVCLKRRPTEPGQIKHFDYDRNLARLLDQPYVASRLPDLLKAPPLVTATSPLEFWCRRVDDRLRFFFADPLARTVTYPVQYGQAATSRRTRVAAVIGFGSKPVALDLDFHPHQSLLVDVSRSGDIAFHDIQYECKQQPLIKGGT